MMDHIQNNNAGSLWDKLTATRVRQGPLSVVFAYSGPRVGR